MYDWTVDVIAREYEIERWSDVTESWSISFKVIERDIARRDYAVKKA